MSHVVLRHPAGLASDQQRAAPVRVDFGGQITAVADGQVFSLGTGTPL
ncbi:hypothetical protein GIY23_12260 [Allosaccharopolyspora coralli]|uniref:Uncharacterized protein n=1 Tax=Allosaccharopolyspora coralli TaxID=2665642 RepID=A0A5Q3QA06_9PSEU|nr:hypothetical protein [Allosaccharopolyspora coralli]QGK70196.1 hypothetical protein GIY23_12260 [Allosaccharopolyspora coralli]